MMRRGPKPHKVEILNPSSQWAVKCTIISREDTSWWNPIGFSSFPNMAIEISNWTSGATLCSHLAVWVMHLQNSSEEARWRPAIG